MTEAIRIELTLTPAVAANADGLGLAASARAIVLRLAETLALPIDPVVALGEATEVHGGPPYSLDIAQQPARLAWSFPVAPGDDAPALRLERDLARNAELLVTDAVASAVRSDWTSRDLRPAAAALPPPELTRLMRECVRAGRSVSRLVNAEAGSDERDPLRWRLLESALENAPSLGVLMPRELAGDEAPETLAESLRDVIYELTGVLLPPVNLRFMLNLPSQRQRTNLDIRLEICDLSLMVPSGDATEPILSRLTAVLQPWLPAFVTRQTVIARTKAASPALPQLVSSVSARFGEAFIARTLRALVAEGVPIGDTRAVLSGLQEIREATTADEENCIVFHAPAGTPPPELALSDGRLDPEDAADCVRRWSRRRITTSHWQAGALRTRLLGLSLESRMREGPLLAGSASHRQFLEQLEGSSDPILTNVDIRRRVADTIALERPDVAVLCYQELLPESSITSTGRIDL